MNVLVIDTASSLEIIAACTGSGAETSALPQTSHSVTILPAIDRCLTRLGLAPGDLDLIGVGVGPGSFTGVRIAVSTARMLAQVTGKPLVGLPTHLLYAVSIPADPGDDILVAFDAKKGRVFGALYRKDGTTPREIVAPGDYVIDSLVAAADPSRAVRCAGNGAEKYASSLAALALRTMVSDITPDGAAICALAIEAHQTHPDRHVDYNSVVPNYARKSDAEAAREAGKKT